MESSQPILKYSLSFLLPLSSQKYEYKILKLEDTPTENLLQYLEETLTYIHEKISNNEKMLVHCYAGRSRSASIVIRYTKSILFLNSHT